MRCGICGRSYVSKQRGLVSAPACRPWFCTTWKYSVWAAALAATMASRAPRSISTTMAADSWARGPWGSGGRARALERTGQRRGEALGGVAHARGRRGLDGPAGLAGDRGDLGLGQAAGGDQLEVGQARGDIEGDAGVGPAPLDADAQRADLARRRALRVDPAAGGALATPGPDSVGGARVGHGRLQGAHERPQEDATVGQADDGVGDELARSVVRHLPAPLRPGLLRPPPGER